MLIGVFALRDDGVNVICYHPYVNDHDHALNRMRSWMTWRHTEKQEDCNPVDFVFYIGEESYHRFTRDRARILLRLIAEARRERRR